MGTAYLVAVGLLVLGLSVTVAVFAFRSRERWLAEGRVVGLGVGAFREGPARTDPVVQNRRWLVVPPAMLNVLVAAVTTFFLVPAGALGALMGVGGHSGEAWFWGGIGIATLDGLPLSLMLVVAAIQLARRSKTAASMAVGVGGWSLVHHGALVALGLALYAVGEYGDRDIGAFTAVAAAIGAVTGLACLLAGLVAAPTPKTVPAMA